MRCRYGIGFLILLSSVVLAQTNTAIDLGAQGRNADFSAFTFTRPVSVGSALPSTCQVGQLFYNTIAPAGANLYSCATQNSWTVIGGYTLTAAGASNLGGVSVPTSSGLTVGNSGALSVNFGTTAGTVAAGNDSRILNALQPGSQMSAANIMGLARSATTDTTNAANITTGTLGSALLPSSAVQNGKVNTYANQSAPAKPTTGNSSCWTDAANKNWECINDAGTVFNSIVASSGAANQFATGIGTNGVISFAQPSFSNLSGTITSSQLGGTVGGDLSGSLPNATVAKINGTSIPGNSSSDQTVVTTGAATGSWTSLPSCLDSGGQHLNYSTSSHSFSCGSSGGTASATFNSLAGGTNTNAAMLVGTGASLAPTGSGSITANAFSGTLSGSNLPSLTGDTTTAPNSSLTTTSKINGTSVPASPIANQALITTGSSTGGWSTVPDCQDTSGQHLNFTQSSHAFSCGSTSSGTGSGGGVGGSGTSNSLPMFNGSTTLGNSSLTESPSTRAITATKDLLFDSQRPGVDVVALGADPTGATDAEPYFASAHNMFNGTNGGTIYACGTFKLNETFIITNPITLASNCGPSGNIFAGSNQRGGLVLTGGTGNEQVPAPTTALTLACSNSGGSLAAGTYYVVYTWVNGFGETPASPAVSCTTTGSSGSIKIEDPVYTDGSFAYNIYASSDGSNYYLQPQGNYANSGGLTGPPFLVTSASSSGYLVPTLTTFSTTGAFPPSSNTTTHGLTLVQIGTPNTYAGAGAELKDVYFQDTGKLAAGLVVLNANHSTCYRCGFDGFTASGTSLGGEVPYEQGGIAYACLNAGNGVNATSNFNTLIHPELYNNTLSVLAACSDFGIDGNGDVTTFNGQVGIDYSAGNIHVDLLHLNIDSGTVASVVARGNNNGDHYGGDFRVKAEGQNVSSGPVFKLNFMSNLNIDLTNCVGPNTSAAGACVVLDQYSNGNIIRIGNQLTQASFSDGTTVGRDPAGTNNITVGGSTPFVQSPLFKSGGNSGYTGTKTVGSCTITFTGGIVTNVTGC